MPRAFTTKRREIFFLGTCGMKMLRSVFVDRRGSEKDERR